MQSDKGCTFADACASLWIDGELATSMGLVLHGAGHDSSTPLTTS